MVCAPTEALANIASTVATSIAASSRGIDIARIAREKLGAFELDRLERIVNQIASREFRAIEWWGAILGFVIGLAQAGIIVLIAWLRTNP